MKVILALATLVHLGLCLEQTKEPLQLPDRCHKNPDPGECGEYNIRWFYNPKVGKCLRFLYRGCEGNDNNFEEEYECHKVCHGTPDKAIPKVNSAGDEIRDKSAPKLAVSLNAGENANMETNEQPQDLLSGEQDELDTDDSAAASPSEDQEPDEDEDELDDGIEDDELIHKHLNIEGGMQPEDEEMLKEAMSQFEVSTLEASEEESEDEIDDHTEEPQEQSGSMAEDQKPIVEPVYEPKNTQNGDNAAETEVDDDDEDEELDDGTADDTIIRQYMGSDVRMEPEDEEMLKETMSQFDVSAMEAQEQEVDDDEENEEEEDTNTPTQQTQNPETDNQALDAVDIPAKEETATNEGHVKVDENGNEEADEDEDEEDDGTIDDALIQKYLRSEMEMDPEDSEMLKEAMSQFEVSAFDPVEEDDNEKVDEDDESMDKSGNENSQMLESREMQADKSETKEETREEYPDDKVDKFLDNLGDKVATDDKDSIKEAISEFGSASLEAMNEINKGIDAAMPHLDSPDGQTSAESQDERHLDREDSEMQDSTRKSGFVDTEVNINLENLQGPTENIASFNPDEFVSQFDGSVMERKNRNFKPKVAINKIPGLPNSDFPTRFGPFRGQIKDKGQTDDRRLLAPMCTLPVEVGPCRARKMKWFFDMDSGVCRTFIYGGCQGNDNRFSSKRKCQKTCRGDMPAATPLGRPFLPQDLPEKKVVQQTSKRITVMMPFRSIFMRRRERPSPVFKLQSKIAIAPEMPPMIDREPKPLPFLNGPEEIDNLERDDKKETQFREGNPEPGPVPPFSPLFHFLFLKNLLKPSIKEEEPEQPMRPPSIIITPRISNERRLPEFPRGEPMPNTYREAPVQPMPRSFNQQADLQTLYSDPRNMQSPFEQRRPQIYQQQNEDDRNHAIFAPSMTKNANIKSANHDNRHFNSVNPKNKFTLLQVFVNKPHGGQTPVQPQPHPVQPQQQPIQSQQQQPIQPQQQQPIQPQQPRAQPPTQIIKPAPHQMGFPPMVYPHSYPMMYPVNPMWQAPMFPHQQMSQMMFPETSPMRNPFARNAPPTNLPRPQFHRRRPPMPERREEERPPVVIVTEGEEDEEESVGDEHYGCLLPLAPGRCKAFQTRWYFNRETSKCDIFYFTGCGGNANNFQTWEECASTCLDIQGPRTTMPGVEKDEEQVDDANTENADELPETIVFTSTVLPDNMEENRKAQQEADAGVSEPPKIEELKTTVNTPVKNEVSAFESAKENADSEEVISEGVHEASRIMSTEYITLMVVVAVIGLAVVVLVTVSIVHLTRKSDPSKKEKVLEAVLNHHLYEDLPKLMVHGGKTPPSDKGAAEDA